MRGNKWRWGGFLSLAVLTAGFLLLGRRPPAPVEVPLPHPNGYDQILEAAQAMPDVIPWRPETMDFADLDSFVRAGHSVLELARQGLALPARPPTPRDLAADMKRAEDLRRLTVLALRFQAESHRLALQGDWEEARRSLLDEMKLGVVTARGGHRADLLRGLSIAAAAGERLRRLVDRLGASQSRASAVELRELVASLPDYAGADAREHAFHSQYVDLRTRVTMNLRFWYYYSYRKVAAAPNLKAYADRDLKVLVDLADKLARRGGIGDPGAGP